MVKKKLFSLNPSVMDDDYDTIKPQIMKLINYFVSVLNFFFLTSS
jgi:hypothetical protein